MRLHGVLPEFHTFPFLLKSFNSPSHFHSGQQIHAQSLLFGLFHDSFIQTSLISMYSSCGNFKFSRQVFDEIAQPDLTSWNSIVNASVKAGLIDVAMRMFDEMPERNVVSWSCVINGCVKCGKFREAISLFREMGRSYVRPNEFTMSSVLSACGRLGALEHGKWAHAYLDKYGIKINVVLGTSLIDMYAKCGSIERARMVFDNLGSDKDVVTWTAMISGLAMHGYGEEALQLFSEMTNHGLTPNAVTILGVLCACVHGGLVNEGKEYFTRMKANLALLLQSNIMVVWLTFMLELVLSKRHGMW
ncbi:Pentatricopeptide repeat (PPR) superfamily protein [Euphorbia peplus]|nr:Pentatricopeptide repeat (PPR) superfamily protein [Euphorbia peplus]